MKIFSVFGVGILRILQSFFNKQASRHMSTTETYLRFGLYFESVASLFGLCYLFLAGTGGLNVQTVICAAIKGLLFLLELLTSLVALRSAPLALCTMCSLGGGIILPTISGIFFFQESLSLLQWLGVALFFISAYFMIYSQNKKQTVSSSTIAVLACNFLINGLCGILSKYFAIRVENGNAALFTCLSYAFAALFFGITLLAIKKSSGFKMSSKPHLPKKLLLFGGMVGIVCASIVYFTTVLSRTVTIVELNTVPNAICLVGSLVMGILLFKEKFTVLKFFGVVLSIVSTTVIVLF